MRLAVSVLALLLVTAACNKNPYTGRLQLDLIPDSQEQKMGVQAYTQLMQDPKVQISHDPA